MAIFLLKITNNFSNYEPTVSNFYQSLTGKPLIELITDKKLLSKLSLYSGLFEEPKSNKIKMFLNAFKCYILMIQ